MIDFIGDIHGHAVELEALLVKLGYTKIDGSYAHPERKVLFVGDYIDRGPKIRETLQLVKAMVDNGSAIALMGNHEYNALCFHLPASVGGHVREHLIKNVIQHYATLKAFQNLQDEYEEYLEWFKTLPLYYETETFRAVHACWDKGNIEFLRKTLVNDRLTDELIYQSAIKGTPLNIALDQTLKGKEITMPLGQDFKDKDGNKRTEVRIRWWENPAEMTYKSIAIEPLDNLPNHAVKQSELPSTEYYKRDEKAVFFGHYWLKGQPCVFKNNVCCLDYSIAKKGKLVAYRFNGEEKLNDSALFYVSEIS